MPKIKASYEKEEDIPEAHKELFEHNEASKKWILVNIEGIDTEGNVQRLTTTVAAIRKENSALKDKLKLYGETTPEQITGFQDKIHELEALVEAGGKPDQEKIERLVDAKVKAKLGPVERENKQLHEKLAASEGNSTKLSGDINKMKIDLAVRAAATKAGVVPSAVEDILALAGGIFEVTEVDGKQKIITRDGIGVTPGLEPEAYLADVGPNKPHWFPGSNGAGAGGGRFGAGFAGNNPWNAATWNMTEQGQIVKTQGLEKAQEMARRAGTTVGGPKPAVKK